MDIRVIRARSREGKGGGGGHMCVFINVKYVTQLIRMHRITKPKNGWVQTLTLPGLNSTMSKVAHTHTHTHRHTHAKQDQESITTISPPFCKL